MFSEYQLQIIEDNDFSLGKTKNLIPNVVNKKTKKLICQNLRFY